MANAAGSCWMGAGSTMAMAGEGSRGSGKGEPVPDYRVYRMTAGDWIRCLLTYTLFDGMISLLFYRSWIAFAAGLPGIWLYRRMYLREKIRLRGKRLEETFMTALQSVSSSLTAGYSAENAFAEACKELEKLYYAEEPVCRELHRIKRMLSVNENLEALLADWAARSGSADIRNFAAVFSAAKRTGGDLNAIIRNTISIMTQKREAQQEIEVSLASRKMEQKVMSGIPLFILAYVGLTSPEFLEGMYYTPVGILVMTAALLLYGGAFLLGRYFVRIEV